MNKVICFFALFGASAGWAQTLDLDRCEFPDAPDMVDGSTASEESMSATATAVRSYVAGTQSALECLDSMEANLGAEITPEQKASLTELYNDRVDQMNSTAQGFNAQVRAYKAR